MNDYSAGATTPSEQDGWWITDVNENSLHRRELKDIVRKKTFLLDDWDVFLVRLWHEKIRSKISEVLMR